MRILNTSAGHEVSVSKNGYGNMLRSFATEMQAVRLEFQAASRELEVQKARVVELYLKVQFLTDDVENAADRQKTLFAKKAELASTNSSLNKTKDTVKENVLEGEQLNYDNDSAGLLSVEGRGSSMTALSAFVPLHMVDAFAGWQLPGSSELLVNRCATAR